MVRHRRYAVLSALATVMLTMPGCWVMTIQPLWFPDEDHPFEPRLVGNWWHERGDCRLRITHDDDQYHVTYSVPAGNYDCLAVKTTATEFEGYLVELGNMQFLDLVPENIHVNNPQVVTAHALYRVSIDDDGLELVPLNSSFVAAAINRHEISGRVDSDKYSDNAIITEGTETLREFVLKHADDREAFTATDDEGERFWRFEPLPSDLDPVHPERTPEAKP